MTKISDRQSSSNTADNENPVSFQLFENCDNYLISAATDESDYYTHYYERNDKHVNLFDNLICVDIDLDETLKEFVPEKKSSVIEINEHDIYPEFDITLKDESIQCMKDFDNMCSGFSWNACENCEQSFPNLRLLNNTCNFCVKNPLDGARKIK